MATPPSPDTIELFKLLEDPDKWYGYYDIKNKIADKVGPGRAVRKYKQRLRESREQRGITDTEILRTENEMIRLGAMACAQVALTTWKGKGIMIRGEGEYKEIRLKPGFQTWGVVSEAQQAAAAAAEAEEAAADAQDPGFESRGYTEVPPSDSEPSEPRPVGPEEVSEPVAEPAVDPVIEMGTVEVVAEPAVDPALSLPAREAEWSPPAEPVVVEDEKPDEMVQMHPEAAEETASPSVSIYEVETCRDCGMGIVDMPVHEDWHEQLRRVTATSGSAFIDPESLRTLVEDVMRQALTRFQVNMQDWLQEQFAEVERQIRLGGKPQSVRSPWAD